MLESILEVLSQNLTANGDKMELSKRLKLESGEYKAGDELEQELKGILSNRFQEIKDESSGEAKRKALLEMEKQVKKTFQFEGGEKGLDLIKAIVEKEKETVKTTSTEPNSVLPDFSKWKEKDWVQIPAFTEGIKNRLTEKEKEIEALKTDFETYKQREVVETHAKNVKDYFKRKLISMNPNGLVEATQDDVIETFIDKNIDPKKVVFNAKKEVEFLNDEGEVLRNDLLQPLDSETLLKTKWWFGFKQTPDISKVPAPNGVNNSVGLDKEIKTRLDDFFKNNKSGYVGYAQSLPSDKRAIAMQYWTSLHA